MSVSLTKSASIFLLCSLLIGHASAETALALPPGMAEDNQTPVVITAPEASGLALPPVVTPVPTPVLNATPVETSSLTDIKPDSVGLLVSNDGGLGAALWKGTSRSLVEHFMPMLSLPSTYPSLNNLAGRFLLTTAAAPEGTASSAGQTLTAMRADKLAALGNAEEAWKLANLNLNDVDDITLRQVAETALVSPAAADVCAKLPTIMQKHTGIEWQKLMLVCQLQAKDTKAAQVSLDLLHTQDVHDDSFFSIAEKNLIGVGTSKQLPRQMTPLKPLTLALARMTDLPVRVEVYARPDAPLIPELLNAKAADENARLTLAERAAAKQIITADELAAVYSSQTFTPDVVAAAVSSNEQGPKLRALLYQALVAEKTSKNKLMLAVKFSNSLDAGTMGGSLLSLLGKALGDVQASADYYAQSAAVTRIYLLTDKTDQAVAWLDLARNAARGSPQVAADLQNLWPLLTISGLEAQKDFAADFDAWLKSTMPSGDQNDTDARAQKAKALSLLLIMDAAGFSVQEDTWAKMADAAAYEKISMPPALVIERLHAASTAGRKGETILMGLLATTAVKDDPALLATIDTIRALRSVGLTTDAGHLAKDAILRIIYPPVKS